MRDSSHPPVKWASYVAPRSSVAEPLSSSNQWWSCRVLPSGTAGSRPVTVTSARSGARTSASSVTWTWPSSDGVVTGLPEWYRDDLPGAG